MSNPLHQARPRYRLKDRAGHGPSIFRNATPELQLFAFFSRNLVASPTVKIVSAASSGISQPNSSSKAITSSTVSRLSAPRSSIKLALSTTFSGSTPRCSTTIFLTRSPISLIAQPRACSIGPTPRRMSHRGRGLLAIAHRLDEARDGRHGPANDGRLRIANIQGFNILQWCSLPIVEVRLSHFLSLDYKPRTTTPWAGIRRSPRYAPQVFQHLSERGGSDFSSHRRASRRL